MEVFSARLKWIRTGLGITQAMMAFKIGMSVPGYTKIENGQREPNLETLAKIANTLDVSSDFLIGLTDLTKNMELMNSHFEESVINVVTLKSELYLIETNPADPNIRMKDYDPNDATSVMTKINNIKKNIPLWEERLKNARNTLLNSLDDVPMVSEKTLNRIKNSDKEWYEILTNNINK